MEKNINKQFFFAKEFNFCIEFDNKIAMQIYNIYIYFNFPL